MSAHNGPRPDHLPPELLAAYVDGELTPAECRHSGVTSRSTVKLKKGCHASRYSSKCSRRFQPRRSISRPLSFSVIRLS